MTPLVGLATAAMGVGVGITSALFGVGGGILMVPFLVLALGLSQHVAEGTSLLVIVPTALIGAIAHHRRGYVDKRAAGWLAAGGVAGALLGALLGLELSGETLQKMFGVLAGVVGARLIYDGLFSEERRTNEAAPSSEGP
jgi:uncharacterized membrane protein YfcA